MAVAALCLGLVLATYPAWRVMMLGKDATLQEVLAILCGGHGVPSKSSAGGAGASPPEWFNRLTR